MCRAAWFVVVGLVACGAPQFGTVQLEADEAALISVREGVLRGVEAFSDSGGRVAHGQVPSTCGAPTYDSLCVVDACLAGGSDAG